MTPDQDRTGLGARRVAVRVEGIVQGVGFRPFVRNLATELALTGSVRNDTAGALIEMEGAPGAVGEFLRRLESDAPPCASSNGW